jgi:small conductance mechanosensitive channel
MNSLTTRLTELMTGLLATHGMNLLGAIVTLVVGFAAANWLAKLTSRAMSKVERIDPVFHPLPSKIVRVAVVMLTLIAVLNRFGVQTTSLIALLGAAGLAVGLALQGTLSNVAAGVMILMFRPFKIGDAVKLGSDVYAPARA